MTEMRIITFTGMTGHCDVPSFTLSQNSDLKIKFVLPESKAGLYRAVVRHGYAPVYTFAFTRSESEILLSASWLNQGGTDPLEISLKRYNDNGTVLLNGGYEIEPLDVLAEDGEFVLTAFMYKYKTELQEMYENFKGEVRAELERFQKEQSASTEMFKGDLQTRMEETEQKVEAFLEEMRTDIETFKGETNICLEKTEQSLNEAMNVLEAEKAVKEKIFEKLEDFADNGAELFPEELK